VTGGILVAELNWEALSRKESSARMFREIERFPAVTRDIAMIVPEKSSNEEILRVIRTPAEPLLESIQLFDLFSGSEASSLGAARKSLAYRLTYRDKNRTLTSEEVSAVHAKIRERLQNEFGAELRE
jgi:phenylalanyl-tRNA synthetase beta chain